MLFSASSPFLSVLYFAEKSEDSYRWTYMLKNILRMLKNENSVMQENATQIMWWKSCLDTTVMTVAQDLI